MYKQILRSALAALLVFLAGCTTTGPGSGDTDLQRRNIDAGVDSALSELFRQVAGSQELTAQARGVLVFPAVLRAGFIFGVSRGQGALRVGAETLSYHATTGGSLGLQAGAQSTAVFLLFMTDEALTRFQNSRGWTVGADASVTLLSVGANAQVTTATAQQPVVGFVLVNGGLMAGVSLDGTRISQLNL